MGWKIILAETVGGSEHLSEASGLLVVALPPSPRIRPTMDGAMLATSLASPITQRSCLVFGGTAVQMSGGTPH